MTAPKLTLTRVGTHSGGTRFEARLWDTSPGAAEIEGAPLRFVQTESGRPIRVMATENGSVQLDLPDNPDLIGKFHAVWLARLSPGTVLSNNGQHLLLFEPLPVAVTSPTKNNPAISWQKAPVIAFDRAMQWLGQDNPVLALLIGAIVLTGIPATIARLTKHESAGWAVLAVEVVALFGACWFLYSVESGDFRSNWADAAKPVFQGTPTALDWVGESSELDGSVAHAFSGACATDGSDASSWLSRRNQGPGEMVAIAFKKPTALTGVRITPGWFDSRDNYNKTAKPQDVEIFSDTGDVVDWQLPETSYDQGPQRRVRDLSKHPIYGTVFYVRVLTIEGDFRTYTAIAEVELVRSAAKPRKHDPAAVNVDVVQPRLTLSPTCSSSQWTLGN